MLDKLEGIRFCEGINIGEAVSIVKNQPQADAFVDHSTFSSEIRSLHKQLEAMVVYSTH